MKLRIAIVAAFAFFVGNAIRVNSSDVPAAAVSLQQMLYDDLFEADWGGQNQDMPLQANQWTLIGEAGGDNAVAVGGEYGFLMLGTIVVTGGRRKGSLQWRAYACGADPETGVYAQAPPLTVRAKDTIAIPLLGSYPLHAVQAGTGQGFCLEALATTDMTIRGGGQSPNIGGNPATVFVGIIAPFHEH